MKKTYANKIIYATLVVFMSATLLSGCTSWSKYEGWTAEEWADEYYAENQKYQELYNCVEQYAYSDECDDLKQTHLQCL